MAVTASVAYRSSGFTAAEGLINFETVTDLYVTLVQNTHVSDVDDVYVGDFTTLAEHDDTNHTWGHAGQGSGRKLISAPAVTLDATAGRIDFEYGAASVTWTSLTAGGAAPTAALIHQSGTTNDTDAYALSLNWFGGTVAANGQDYIVSWDSGNSQDYMRWTFS